MPPRVMERSADKHVGDQALIPLSFTHAHECLHAFNHQRRPSPPTSRPPPSTTIINNNIDDDNNNNNNNNNDDDDDDDDDDDYDNDNNNNSRRRGHGRQGWCAVGQHGVCPRVSNVSVSVLALLIDGFLCILSL
jgi:hypothetical protein